MKKSKVIYRDGREIVFDHRHEGAYIKVRQGGVVGYTGLHPSPWMVMPSFTGIKEVVVIDDEDKANHE